MGQAWPGCRSLNAATSARGCIQVAARTPEGRLLFRAGSESRHVVGHNLVADELRAALLSGSAPGWSLHRVPDPGTALHLLQSHLEHARLPVAGSRRFTTVEDVIETPDMGLLDRRNAGRNFLAPSARPRPE